MVNLNNWLIQSLLPLLENTHPTAFSWNITTCLKVNFSCSWE